MTDDLRLMTKYCCGGLRAGTTPFLTNIMVHHDEMSREQIAKVFSSTSVKKGVTFKLNISDSVPSCISLDPLRFSQVINNILSNAGKFTESGDITMSCTMVNDRMQISIRD